MYAYLYTGLCGNLPMDACICGGQRTMSDIFLCYFLFFYCRGGVGNGCLGVKGQLVRVNSLFLPYGPQKSVSLSIKHLLYFDSRSSTRSGALCFCSWLVSEHPWPPNLYPPVSSLVFHHWDYRCVLVCPHFFCRCWGRGLRSSCLYSPFNMMLKDSHAHCSNTDYWFWSQESVKMGLWLALTS